MPSVCSSVPCTSLEVFQASFWMMCWPTPLRPAWPSLTQICVLLLGRAFAAIGSKVDVFPGSQNHLRTLFLLLFALHDLVCHSRLFSWFFSVRLLLSLQIFSLTYQHISPKTCSTITHKCCSQEVYPSMRVIIILEDLASEVCLHIIMIGTEGQCCNNYPILK